MIEPDETQSLLLRIAGGDAAASDDLVRRLYGELRKVAMQLMQGERRDHTLAPTALVHEAYLRLLGGAGEPPHWESRRHFLRAAARAMRRVLIDHARARGASRRVAGAERLPLDDTLAWYEENGLDVLALDESLGRLATVDPDLTRLVELRFFGGLSHAEVGEALGMSLRSAERGWQTARAFLEVDLGPMESGR